LLFIEVNGPPLAYSDPEKFATSWLKNGHYSAIDQPTGKQFRASTMETPQSCFLTHRNEHIYSQKALRNDTLIL